MHWATTSTRWMMPMKRDLHYERHYQHPPHRVWYALTNPDALAQWFAESDFKPEVGHQFELRTGDTGPGYDGILHCEVIDVDEPNRLVYSFRGGAMNHVTTVTWTLEADAEGGTRLILDHTGFTGVKDVIISSILGIGWMRFLGRLPGVLDELSTAKPK